MIKANNTEESINLITRMQSTELKEVDEDGRTILHWIAEKNNNKLANIALKNYLI
ncbi:MAG TPA: hypothetical protein LFV90_00755 [Rickettsia endosymbiont of Columbicola hoogstraali]|nr:hypothetical protein [Rickettsia endosymbiont of Columbicola hoogstraali]